MSWVIEMMMLVVEMDMFQAQKLNKKNRQEIQEWLHSRVQHILIQSAGFSTVRNELWPKKDDYEFDSEGGTTMSVDMCAHYDHYVGNPYFEIRFIQ